MREVVDWPDRSRRDGTEPGQELGSLPRAPSMLTHDRRSPLDARTAAQRRGSGASGRVASRPARTRPHIDIEYNAIRNAAALIDVSPLFKYRVSGPGRDAPRRPRHHPRRVAVAPGRVVYTPWCDDDGKVIDDGTVHRLDDGSYRWTAADPQLRWLRLNARGLDVTIEDRPTRSRRSRSRGRCRAPCSRRRRRPRWPTCATSAGARCASVAIDVDVSRTGYTGDLGYELWVDAGTRWRCGTRWSRPARPTRCARPASWRSTWPASRPASSCSRSTTPRPARPDAGADIVAVRDRPRAGSSTSTRRPFVGRRALRREPGAGGPPRRLVGLDLDWADLERLHARHGLAPALPAQAWRDEIPGLRRRPPGRPGDERHLERRPQAEHRARDGRGAARPSPARTSRWSGRSRASAAASAPPWRPCPSSIRRASARRAGAPDLSERGHEARVDPVDLADAVRREDLAGGAVGDQAAAVQEQRGAGRSGPPGRRSWSTASTVTPVAPRGAPAAPSPPPGGAGRGARSARRGRAVGRPGRRAMATSTSWRSPIESSRTSRPRRCSMPTRVMAASTAARSAAAGAREGVLVGDAPEAARPPRRASRRAARPGWARPR